MVNFVFNRKVFNIENVIKNLEYEGRIKRVNR